MRVIFALVAAVLGLALAGSAAAKVRLVSVTSPASPGQTATLTVRVSPPATCSIIVRYQSGPSHAQGLGSKRSGGGRVTWSWTVGHNTTPGRWPITISCGKAGTLHTPFVVK